MEKKTKELEEIVNERAVKEDTPMIATPDNPSKEEIERHALTLANNKDLCKYCRMGLARRKQYRIRAQGEVDVPDTEDLVDGESKYRMDYAILVSHDSEVKNSILVIVIHEDGGIFTYVVAARGCCVNGCG